MSRAEGPPARPSRRSPIGGRDRIWARFLVAALLVAAISLGVVAVGVLRVAASSFAALMMAAGESADHAHAMFDESVAVVFGLAAALAAVIAVAVAMLLAHRLARPVERVAAAARRLADGDLAARVPEEGPAELRELAAAYNAMADRLAEQELVRREFIVNASHELRTPLTNLQGYLEALRDGVIPPDPATFDSLREEVDRLTRLASSLDVLAGAGTERGPARSVDLGLAVRGAVDLVAPALARRSIGLRVDAPDGVTVRARPDELAQVLANLLQNAVRYTPAGGEVVVTVDRGERRFSGRAAERADRAAERADRAPGLAGRAADHPDRAADRAAEGPSGRAVERAPGGAVDHPGWGAERAPGRAGRAAERPPAAPVGRLGEAEARVRVANTGPGIPPEDLPRVWERFYRVEKSRDASRGGAGVGLAIVRQLVEEAGGRVGATSDDSWTTFWLTLPA